MARSPAGREKRPAGCRVSERVRPHKLLYRPRTSGFEAHARTAVQSIEHQLNICLHGADEIHHDQDGDCDGQESVIHAMAGVGRSLQKPCVDSYLCGLKEGSHAPLSPARESDPPRCAPRRVLPGRVTLPPAPARAV